MRHLIKKERNKKERDKEKDWMKRQIGMRYYNMKVFSYFYLPK